MWLVLDGRCRTWEKVRSQKVMPLWEWRPHWRKANRTRLLTASSSPHTIALEINGEQESCLTACLLVSKRLSQLPLKSDSSSSFTILHLYYWLYPKYMEQTSHAQNAVRSSFRQHSTQNIPVCTTKRHYTRYTVFQKNKPPNFDSSCVKS